MKSISVIPHTSLQPFIQTYIFMSVGPKGAPLELDLCPLGHCVLSFVLDGNHFIHNASLGKDYSIRFNFTGQLSKYHLLRTTAASMVYVIFKPHGVYRLLGVPQHQLADDCTAMSDMLNKEVYDLCKRMEDHEEQPFEVIRLLEEWLLGQWQKNYKLNTDRIAFACTEISRHAGALSIKEVCGLTNMSKSSLENYFKEQVGLTPKLYSRVIRFNEIHRRISNSVEQDWQEIVFLYGYFDQAHFIHEFKHFFGHTPSRIYQGNQNISTHVSEYLPDTSF
jgi:AraC-like DNA-binding protein